MGVDGVEKNEGMEDDGIRNEKRDDRCEMCRGVMRGDVG